jgi:hypothetical protein
MRYASSMRVRIALVLLVAPLCMAPECGPTPSLVDCSTSDPYFGAHAFEPDGTLVLLTGASDGVTWKRIAPPWDGTPAIVTKLPAGPPTAVGVFPRIVPAPGGARLVARGPMGALDTQIYDVDAAGGHLVKFGTSTLDYVDFAVTWDGGAPSIAARRYTTDGRLTVSILRGPPAAGDAWREAGRFDADVPPVASDVVPVVAQPIAIAREQNGDLVSFDIDGGFAVLSANDVLTQTPIALTGTPRSVTALVENGTAVLYVLTDAPFGDAADGGASEGGGGEGGAGEGGALEGGAKEGGASNGGIVTTLDRHHIERIRHTTAGFVVDTLLEFGGPSTQHLDLINDQIAAVDSTHLVASMSSLGGGPNGDYALFSLAPDKNGTWASNVVCTSERCENVGWWRGFSRLAVSPEGAIATTGASPQNDPAAPLDDGTVTILDESSTPARAVSVGDENSHVSHPCATVK